MSTALENMAISLLSKMTGLSPEQMEDLANKGIALIESVDNRLKNIEAVINQIAPLLPAKEQGDINEAETVVNEAQPVIAEAANYVGQNN